MRMIRWMCGVSLEDRDEDDQQHCLKIGEEVMSMLSMVKQKICT